MSNGKIDTIVNRDFDRAVLVCFVTQWCHSCYPTCLLANKLAEEYDGRVKFVKVDIEKSPEVAASYHIIVVPTTILFHDSQVVKKLIGFQDRIVLMSLLDSVTAGEDATRAG